MHAIRTRSGPSERTTPSAGPFPWEEGHAAPEDRAVGLELELIDLVTLRRSEVRAYDGESEVLDAEIGRTLDELGSLVPVVPVPA